MFMFWFGFELVYRFNLNNSHRIMLSISAVTKMSLISLLLKFQCWCLEGRHIFIDYHIIIIFFFFFFFFFLVRHNLGYFPYAWTWKIDFIIARFYFIYFWSGGQNEMHCWIILEGVSKFWREAFPCTNMQ